MDAGRRRWVISRRVRRVVEEGGAVGKTSNELPREEAQRVVTARNPEVKKSE